MDSTTERPHGCEANRVEAGPSLDLSVEYDTIRTAGRWLAQGERVVVATLTAVEGSAPFAIGAMMLFDGTGRVEGSVTGGCIEAELAQAAEAVLARRATTTKSFGVSDPLTGGAGLMCGGTVDVVLTELSAGSHDAISAVAGAMAAGEQSALITTFVTGQPATVAGLVGDRLTGSLRRGEEFDRAITRDAIGCLGTATSTLRHYGAGGRVMGTEISAFIRAFATPRELIILGAIDFSAAVARLARQLGFRVTIADARPPFIRSDRFDAAHDLKVAWPQELFEERKLRSADAVLVFTHDPKFDEPALIGALASGAGYIGALGSRKVQANRRRRLRAAGVPESELDRIAAPCGLDIGAKTPEETAVSIMAEVVAHASNRVGAPLSSTSGSIHERGQR